MLTKRITCALRLGGLKTALLSLVCYIVVFGLELLLLGRSMLALLLGGVGEILWEATPEITALASVVGLIVAIFIGSGQLGSFKDCVEETGVSLKTYFSNSKKYFLRTLCYGILCVVLIALLVTIFIYLPVRADAGTGTVWLVLGQVVCTILLNVYILPLYYLTVVGYETNGFVKENFLSLLAFALLVGLVLIIPLLGFILGAILQLFYPLLVFVLHQEQSSFDSRKKLGTPV